jgi:pectate lyase
MSSNRDKRPARRRPPRLLSVPLVVMVATLLSILASGRGPQVIEDLNGIFGTPGEDNNEATPEIPASPTVADRQLRITAWSEEQTYQRGELVRYHGRIWEAQASIAAGHAPLGIGNGSGKDQRLLLSRREGFGRRVTGGYVSRTDAEVVHVTTAADSGPGSLREAVRGDDPRWIIFDGDYNIQLKTGLMVGSNKTIDGRGRDILIQSPDDGDEDNWGLRIYDESNVIVHNIRFDQCGDYTKQIEDDQNDCIDIIGANKVWIDHATLSQAADKLISVAGGSENVTVSWSHFSENVSGQFDQQVFQIAAASYGEAVERNSTVTLHHNFFDDTGERHPMIMYGAAHAYNNYVYSFKWLGMGSFREAQLVVEGNILENTEDVEKDATKYDIGDGCNNGICDPRDGYIKLGNNSAINARLLSNHPRRVFVPRSIYSYELDRPNDSLRDVLVGFSGLQPVVWAPSH